MQWAALAYLNHDLDQSNDHKVCVKAEELLKLANFKVYYTIWQTIEIYISKLYNCDITR
jgi:hypothetical protein